MKTFKKYMSEMAGVNPNSQGFPMDNQINPAALSNPKVIQRLNAYVGAIAGEQTKIVEDAIANLRQKLMRVGLQFGEVPMFEGDSGSFSLPLSLFGGRFGKDENTPHDEFLNDDGISNQVEGGLSLNISYEMSDENCYMMRCKIQ
tara:strand:+ start:4109 stop:4543 length:435 start_codon:yes stop_codon:yes gene_type:complete